MSEPLGEGRVEFAAQGGDYGETLGIGQPRRNGQRGHGVGATDVLQLALQLLQPGPMGGDGLGEVGHMRRSSSTPTSPW